MTDKVVVLVTFENEAQARKVAEAVVGEKLAACVNVVRLVNSCYVWEGKMTWSDEALGVIKTTRGKFARLEKRIRELHSYDTPEIISLGIEDGSEKYLAWIDRSVGE